MNTALNNNYFLHFFFNSTIIEQKYKKYGSVSYVVVSGYVKILPIMCGAEKKIILRNDDYDFE